MKQFIAILVCLVALAAVSPAQITTIKSSGTMTPVKNSSSTTSIAGNWSGTQTSSDGLYPQAISFQLTNNGEFIIAGQTGVVASRGNYTTSNNIITGSYRQLSSGETYSFSCTFDPATKQLKGTLGSGGSVSGQGKWTVTKIEIAQMQNPVSTTVKRVAAPVTTTQTSSPAPPPAAVYKTNTVVGRWSGIFLFPYSKNPISYSLVFDAKNGFVIIDNTADPFWDDTRIGQGSYILTNRQVKGNFYFKNDPTGYSFSATLTDESLSSTKLIGTYGMYDSVSGRGTLALTAIQPAPGPAPIAPPVNNEYYLMSVKLNIYTGNDNKEALSWISANLFLPPGSGNYSINPGNASPTMIYTTDEDQSKYKFEFKPNSVTSVELVTYCSPGLPGNPEYRSRDITLTTINRGGLKAVLAYYPNFSLDAWKIEKIEMVLDFRKTDGTPHPTLGNKTLYFPKASGLLTQGKNSLILETDRFLIPINQ
jgi:hypothetical protein